MSGVVHFKFGHAQGFDRLTFEGHFISVGDLKRLITEKRQLGSGPAGALALADPETGAEYGDDGHLLRRNAAVIVKRVPLRAPGAAAVIQSAPAPDRARELMETFAATVTPARRRIFKKTRGQHRGKL